MGGIGKHDVKNTKDKLYIIFGRNPQEWSSWVIR